MPLLTFQPLDEQSLAWASTLAVQAHEWSPISQIVVTPQAILEQPNSVWLAVYDVQALVGIVGFHGINWLDKSCHLAWGVLPQHRRNGYATAIARQALDYAYKVYNLHRCVVETLTDGPSVAICQRAGMKAEGIHKAARWKHGEYKDAVTFALVREA